MKNLIDGEVYNIHENINKMSFLGDIFVNEAGKNGIELLEEHKNTEIGIYAKRLYTYLDMMLDYVAKINEDIDYITENI